MKRKLYGKVIKNVHSGKKSTIDYIERRGKTDLRVWLTGGSWLTRKNAIKNYQIYWRGWKSPLNFLR